MLVWETLAIFAPKRTDMKKKFDNTDNILGGIVKKVRQEKGLSQEALGKYVGLGKSSISKIESGKTNISIDDASVLLEAMGEKLSVYRQSVSVSRDHDEGNNLCHSCSLLVCRRQENYQAESFQLPPKKSRHQIFGGELGNRADTAKGTDHRGFDLYLQ